MTSIRLMKGISMEVRLVDDVRAKQILGHALMNYDGSGDWWEGIDDDLDVNVYVEDGEMHVVLYPYHPLHYGEQWQTLVVVNRQEKTNG